MTKVDAIKKLNALIKESEGIIKEALIDKDFDTCSHVRAIISGHREALAIMEKIDKL